MNKEEKSAQAQLHHDSTTGSAQSPPTHTHTRGKHELYARSGTKRKVWQMQLCGGTNEQLFSATVPDRNDGNNPVIKN